MAKALIVCASRSGATTKIADLIVQGISRKGVEAKVLNALHIHKAEELQGYDAYVFGSATYHGDMLPFSLKSKSYSFNRLLSRIWGHS